MKSIALHVFAACALGLLATACDRRQKDEPPPPPEPKAEAADVAHLPPGIGWYPGEVDAAFAAAKAADKPLFLYWGAEWCPPCAQVKATIFNQREFQARSKLFLPVYLDGDTPSAQKQGERFGVVGYPTMILFRPDGTEITRLPGTVDVTRYATILDVALAAARPAREVVERVRAGKDVSANDWRLLAFNAWASDVEGRVVPLEERLPTFRTLAQRCPAGELPGECGRLFFEYLAAASAASGARTALDGLERADSRRRLITLLPNPLVQSANVDNLLYASKDAVTLLSDPASAERRDLTRAWGAALDRLADGDGATVLSPPERLSAIRARIVLAKLGVPDAPVLVALLAEARRAVAEVDANTTDAYARQAAINAAANLYWEAGLSAEANTLLTAELAKSKTPYYFMLDLADLAEKAGRKQEAVDWLARAYAGAQGPATRFQWGYNYLVGLLEMTPEDTAGIERAGLSVLDELDRAPDAFYQRTRLRLEQLDAKLLDWGRAGDAAKVVARLRTRTGAICGKLPANDPGRDSCEKFLNPAARAAQAA
ncbi:MAG: thioredoxin family protein [Steroidobacteraceae bacterium]